MASVESIGACSLDFETSAAENFITKELTASECTLHSHGLSPSIKELSRNGNELLEDMSFKEQRIPDISKLTNGQKHGEKREFTVAEIKLPSYVSISCAINGYTNYSRFCRSRDNSPARSSFRKSSLEPSMLSDLNGKESNHKMHTNTRYSRSQSDCNGTMHSIYTESKHVTVSKQLQIPLKSTKKYMTEVTITNGHSEERTSKSLTKAVTNGHDSENLALAKEVGNGGTKSLVQQRIESLYGKSFSEEIKLCVKSSNKSRELQTDDVERSFSPQNNLTNGKSHKGSVSPPVFRHLNKDFRKQLQANALEDKKSETEKHITKLRKKSSEKSLPQVPKENGFSSVISDRGLDECDRAISKTPPPKLNHVSIDSEKSLSKDIECEREGYKFLSLVDLEKEKIEIEVKRLEAELKNNPTIPEEACGKIRAACGKANLLMSQKFEQFKGLCWQNIEENPNVPFYTTASDLAGFWDMVMLQVDDIKSTFREIEIMKKNDWKEILAPRPAEIKPRNSNLTAVSKSNPNTPKRSAKSIELAKAREEARKQLLAAKKKGRQQHAPDESDVAIFAPASSS